MSHEVIRVSGDTVEEAFINAARSRLNSAVHKIAHCVDQLSDEQVWQRPQPEMNSIANLILHLCGNLRQWIVSGVGGAKDHRDRPAEFSDRSMRPKAELLAELRSAIGECHQVMGNVDPRGLLVTRRIQGFDVQLLPAMMDTISHLQGHVQEIIHMTRAIRGSAYRFDFVPQGKEQGGAVP